MARPSNQCRYRLAPTSKRAGPLRNSAPDSHAGSVPETGSASTATSFLRVVKPSWYPVAWSDGKVEIMRHLYNNVECQPSLL